MDINLIHLETPASAELGSFKEPDSGELLPDDVQAELQELDAIDTAPMPLRGRENFGAPPYIPKKEHYVHRLIAYLKATQPGISNRELAEKVGRHEVTVGYILRQPWMEQAILTEIKKVYDPTLQLLQNESFASAERLIEIAKVAKNEETKRKANINILEIKYGKPNQPMTVQRKAASEMSDADLMKLVDTAHPN